MIPKETECIYSFAFFYWFRMQWYSGMGSKLLSLSAQEIPSEVQVRLRTLVRVAMVLFLPSYMFSAFTIPDGLYLAVQSEKHY